MNLKGKKRGLIKALEFDLRDKEKGMQQDEIAKKKKTKEKETPPDQPQPSSLRTNPSSSVGTPPNLNFQ